MTLEELESLLLEANWFEHLAEPLVTSGPFVSISSLAPWADLSTGDETLEEIADKMDWLPSSRDQHDPIYGESLEERSEQLGKREDFSRRSLDIYKKALTSLRRFEGHPALRIGPHDFTEAARGAALFASRRAAYEILLGDSGLWCSILSVYQQGHWPCGILPNSNIVVL
jgi:hypothetical protein